MWILIIVLMSSNGSIATTTAEFTTKDKCYVAGNSIMEVDPNPSRFECYEK